MTDTNTTKPRITRRMWLAGLGGGLLSVPFLRWFDLSGRSGRSGSPEPEDASSITFVDRDGWMLTPEDAAALAARPAAQ